MSSQKEYSPFDNPLRFKCEEHLKIGIEKIWEPVQESNCRWRTDNICGGKIKQEGLFGKGITAYICEKHFYDHLCIMAVARHYKNYDLTLKMSFEERQQEVIKLNLKLEYQ